MRSKCALATRPAYPQELPCSRDTREWGVETSLRCTLVELLAGWHARMSNRLAGKGACALCIASVSNIRLRPSPLMDMRGRRVTDQIEALERITKLKSDGMLTEEEFAAQKAAILTGASNDGATPEAGSTSSGWSLAAQVSSPCGINSHGLLRTASLTAVECKYDKLFREKLVLYPE